MVPPFSKLRHFHEGRGFKQWTGDDSKALMKVHPPNIGLMTILILLSDLSSGHRWHRRQRHCPVRPIVPRILLPCSTGCSHGHNHQNDEGLPGNLTQTSRSLQNVGHPGGRLLVSTSNDENGVVKSAIVFRTARKIMDGSVYI